VIPEELSMIPLIVCKIEAILRFLKRFLIHTRKGFFNKSFKKKNIFFTFSKCIIRRHNTVNFQVYPIGYYEKKNEC
jgi:hypothetical protein